MDSMDAGKQPLWYLRQGQAVKGPFPSGGLRRFLLLGRLGIDDEISRDRRRWQKIRDVPEVIPPDIRKALADGDAEALLPARLREDERTGRDRRSGAPGPDHQQRRGGERRRQEPVQMQRHRASRARLLQSTTKQRIPVVSALVIGLTLVLAIGSGWYLGAPDSIDDPDCAMPPQAWVNWRNCRLDKLQAESADLEDASLNNASLRAARLSGARLDRADLRYADLSTADLSYTSLVTTKMKGAALTSADLSYADLSRADMSFANLQGANLGGALLQGTQLEHAIWVDGQRCGQGSVGRCLVGE